MQNEKGGYKFLIYYLHSFCSIDEMIQFFRLLAGNYLKSTVTYVRSILHFNCGSKIAKHKIFLKMFKYLNGHIFVTTRPCKSGTKKLMLKYPDMKSLNVQLPSINHISFKVKLRWSQKIVIFLC